MTREQIIAMREECDKLAEQYLQCKGEFHPNFHTVSDEFFAALVAAAEREQCASIVDNWKKNCHISEIATAIRARGNDD